MSRKLPAAVILSVAISFGCASNQSISVETTPPGAEITLTRFGVTEYEGGGAGASVGGLEDSFEDEPIYLGTSPLDYEFELEEAGRSVSVGGFSAEAVRRYTEGLIRAERDGEVAERRVRFTGDPISLQLLLTDQ